jgi:glycosyltransferase involved in cell wall biosynthesis
MLIVHVITSLGSGGAELMLKRLVLAHKDSPHFKHYVISLQGGPIGPQLESAGVSVETLNIRNPLLLPVAVAMIARRFLTLKPDVVQTWMYHSDLIGGIAARLVGIKNVLWGVRATHIPPGQGQSRATSFVRSVCALLSRWVPSRIIYVAEAARTLHEQLGYAPSKSLVIFNGFKAPEVQASEHARAELRRILQIPAEVLLIGTAGRFNVVKDYPTFITAAGKLAPHHPQLNFVMVGRGLDPDNEILLKQIKGTGYEDRFHLLGEQANLNPVLAGLDIFCLHSISEGFPNVVGEAMAVGVPCVVTAVGDAALLVGEHGLVVPAADPSALGEKLDRLLHEDAEARQARGLASRARVLNDFSMTQVTAKYEALYAGLPHRSVSL